MPILLGCSRRYMLCSNPEAGFLLPNRGGGCRSPRSQNQSQRRKHTVLMWWNPRRYHEVTRRSLRGAETPAEPWSVRRNSADAQGKRWTSKEGKTRHDYSHTGNPCRHRNDDGDVWSFPFAWRRADHGIKTRRMGVAIVAGALTTGLRVLQKQIDASFGRQR